MRPIDSITIRGFKSVKNLEQLHLGRLNVLIGANGAGKSNLVSFFYMLSELVEGRLQVWAKKQGGANRIVTNGVKETKKVEFSMKFDRNVYEVVLEPTVDDGFTFLKETPFFDGPYYGKGSVRLGSGHSESKLKKRETKISTFCYDAISRWKVYHFHDTSDTAGVKRIGSLHDNEYLRPDASNLAAFLFRLKNEEPKVYEQIRKTVRLALPSFDDFVLKPQRLETGEEQIWLLWRQLDSDYAFWPSQLSDGSIRFICLVTALLQPDPPTTTIIDEPELGLHPYALTLLGALMRSASERMQLVISTQSVALLNEFSIKQLIVVESKNGVSTFKRLDTDQYEKWLVDFTIGELWEKNVIGGRPTR